MPINYKSRREIEMMRKAGRVLHRVVQQMRSAVAPGVTTKELDDIARAETIHSGAVSMILNYPTYKPSEGFPGFTCVSINEQVVHGIPSTRRLVEGDILSLDMGAKLEGFFGDCAVTIPVGRVADGAAELLRVTVNADTNKTTNVKSHGARWARLEIMAATSAADAKAVKRALHPVLPIAGCSLKGVVGKVASWHL